MHKKTDRKRVTLIVDDDELMRLVHKHIISSAKLSEDPIFFADGRKAFDFLLENYSAEEDYLILLDLDMPVMNGWEFLNLVDAEFPEDNVDVVVVSTSIDAPHTQKREFYRQVVLYTDKKPVPYSYVKILKTYLETKKV